MPSSIKRIAGLVAAVVAVAIVAGPTAQAQNPTPANKTAAIGNTIEDQAPNTDHVVLSEQLRVSSPADFIINLSAECSILTQLVTGADGTSPSEDNTTGRVEMYVTIDGKRVPVAGDPNGNGGDNGQVTFCDREYGRQVTDREGDGSVDEIDDYIRTRSATSFQWLATNVGFAYDSPANGQNIINVDVHAVYTDEDPASGAACQPDYKETCSEALIGKRTLIVENTKASVVENTINSTGGQ